MNANPPPAAPKTATLHHLPGLPDPEPPESIARGCALALGGIATVLFELEGEVQMLEALDADPPSRIVGDEGYYERRICEHERTIRALTEAQKVLEGLAAETHAHIAWARAPWT